MFPTDRIYMDAKDSEKATMPLNPLIPLDRSFKPSELKNKLFQITTACPWSKCFRRKFVINKGLKYQSCNNANDVFFTRTALTRAKTIVAVDEPLVTYRANISSSTQGRKDKSPFDFYNAYKAVKDYLVEHNIYEKYRHTFINTVIQETVWNYNTFKTEKAKQQVKELFQKNGVNDFELDKINTYDVDNFVVYEQFKQIVYNKK